MVPLSPRRAQGGRGSEEARRLAPPSRLGRRHFRQRLEQVVSNNRCRVRRGRARQDPGAHWAGEGGPEGPRPLPGGTVPFGFRLGEGRTVGSEAGALRKTPRDRKIEFP
jgi:hypothetical protein